MKDWTRHPNYWRNVIETGAYWTESINANGLDIDTCRHLYQQEHRHQRHLLTEHLPDVDKYTLADVYQKAKNECDHAGRGEFRGYAWTDMLLNHATDADHHESVKALGPLPDVPQPLDTASVMHCIKDRLEGYNLCFQDAVFRERQADFAREAYESEIEWAPVAGD